MSLPGVSVLSKKMKFILLMIGSFSIAGRLTLRHCNPTHGTTWK